MDTIEEENSEDSVSSPEELNRTQRLFSQRTTLQEDTIDRATRFPTFVSAYEDPRPPETTLKVPETAFSRSAPRRYGPLSSSLLQKESSGKEGVSSPTHSDSETSPLPDRKSMGKGSDVEVFPTLVRGLETRVDYQYRRSDSAFDSRLPANDMKEAEEEVNEGDDGVTGGDLAYKARVEMLYKLALGGVRPQDTLYRLIRLKPEEKTVEWTEERNHMKDKDLLFAAFEHFQGLNSAYDSVLQAQ